MLPVKICNGVETAPVAFYQINDEFRNLPLFLYVSVNRIQDVGQSKSRLINYSCYVSPATLWQNILFLCMWYLVTPSTLFACTSKWIKMYIPSSQHWIEQHKPITFFKLILSWNPLQDMVCVSFPQVFVKDEAKDTKPRNIRRAWWHGCKYVMFPVCVNTYKAYFVAYERCPLTKSQTTGV